MIDPADAPMSVNSEYPTLVVGHRDLGGGVCAVAVEGEVDLASAPGLKSGLTELPSGFDRFIIDLSAVPHMDSTGLGVLVGFRRRLPDPKQVALAAPQENVRAVFELTGLDFQIFETVDAAAEHFGRLAARESQPALSADSAMVIGLVSTALPFADSRLAEAERWLRVLRLHGEAGRALTALGLSEAALPEVEQPPAPAIPAGPAGRDPIAAVLEYAKLAAAERSSVTVGTADLLRGVLHVYGPDFEWVLRARGSDPVEVIEQLDRPAVAA